MLNCEETRQGVGQERRQRVKGGQEWGRGEMKGREGSEGRDEGEKKGEEKEKDSTRQGTVRDERERTNISVK